MAPPIAGVRGDPESNLRKSRARPSQHDGCMPPSGGPLHEAGFVVSQVEEDVLVGVGRCLVSRLGALASSTLLLRAGGARPPHCILPIRGAY